jgi:hypothetical protein
MRHQPAIRVVHAALGGGGLAADVNRVGRRGQSHAVDGDRPDEPGAPALPLSDHILNNSRKVMKLLDGN